jgi:hypothetical protein
MRNAISSNGATAMPTMQPEPIANQGQVSPTGERGAEASRARFAFTVEYNGHRRATELPLSQEMIQKLALEAQFRDMQMGQLLSELIASIMNKDLFQLVLGEEIAELPKLQMKNIQIFPR